MALKPDFEKYINDSLPELKQLIRDLCAIPAPTHHEEQRAEFCREWFEKNGGQSVFVDEALNVVCPYCVDDDGEVAVVMAHTDTVFPDMEPMPFEERDGKMFCPGVNDDTANLAVMMICARYIFTRQVPVKMGIVFVANSCEEGLGNLKGSRKIVESYSGRIREFITLDHGCLHEMVTQAVGSHRYRVTVCTDGGHSFSHFGSKNAIACLAEMIQELYSVELPVEPGSKTTYNVGVISGGTSVNTIAPSAEMLYEYRSDSLYCLGEMERKFRGIVEGRRSADVRIEVEKIGDRPCAGNVDPKRHRALIERVDDAIRAVTGRESVCCSGSTDANAALAEGIPSVCIGGCIGGKAHTREEWLDVESLADGCRLLMHILDGYSVVKS